MNELTITDFTEQVTLDLADVLEIDYSDADAIVSANEELVNNLYYSARSVSHVVKTICDLDASDKEAVRNADLESAIYEQGWIDASIWADRTDLIADIGSPGYNKVMKVSIDSIVESVTKTQDKK